MSERAYPYFCVCACVCESLPIFYSQIVEEGPFVSHETTGGFRLTNEFLCVLINQASHTHLHQRMHPHTHFLLYRIGW